MDLHMYYTLNMTGVNYFCMQIPEMEEINGQMRIDLSTQSAELHARDLTKQKLEDCYRVMYILLLEKPVILTLKDLQVESH